MFIRGALEVWKRWKHGPRVQEKAIEHIAERIETLEAIQSEEGDYNIILKPILDDCKKHATLDVDVRKLRRWWCAYEEWVEFPHVEQKIKKDIEKKMAGNNKK